MKRQCEAPPVEAAPELDDGVGFEGGSASLDQTEENSEDMNQRREELTNDVETGRRNPVRKRQMPHRYR